MKKNAWTQRPRAVLVWVAAIAAAGALLLWPQPARASDPPTQPLEPVLTLVNQRVGVAHEGIGTFDVTEGSFIMEIPGTQVRHAYLIWAGLGRDDDGILLARDGGTPVRVTHDWVWNNTTFGGSTWNCCGFELSVYAADITGLDVAALGLHQYDVSDMAITGGSAPENWGVSLLVIYDDPTITQPRDVIVKLGNDGLHFRWGGALGPNSDVQCVAFAPAPFDRTVETTVVVGGIKNIYRPNGLWGRTGNEEYVDPDRLGGTWTQDRGLIDGVSGITGIGGGYEIDGPLDGDKTGNGVDWPFTDNLSDQWDRYPPFAMPVPAGDEWACIQIESANRPEIERGEGTFNLGASIGFVGMVMIFENEVVQEPAIDLEKATNGKDADNPPGPTITVGDAVTWTYAVTNTGNVTLTNVTVTDDVLGAITCPQTTLAPGGVMTCTAFGTATEGQYANLGTVTGETETGQEVNDEDPSHYNGRVADEPAIDLEKATNGEDADDPPGPTITVGDPVTWTYVVVNTGNVTLTNVAVTDDVLGAIDCPQTTLAPGAEMTCTAGGTAAEGQYANLGTVTGETETGQEVSDEDPSHYNGRVADQPAIDLEKATNGEDADDPPGPTLEVGAVVTWTFVVTNIGNVALVDVAVTDDQIGAIACPQTTLAVDEVMTCTANGIAQAGQYANMGTVTGNSATTGETVTDLDPSHYSTQPTGLDETDEPTAPVQQRVFIPVLRME